MLTSIAPYGERYPGSVDHSLSLKMSRASRRGPWLPEEDQALLQLVRTQGANNWVRISQQIQHRSPKQCRERYHQNLKPSLKHDPISAQEGEVIERLVQEMGKRWAEIARRLGNRSDNAVKNWWNGSVNRRRRNPAHSAPGFKQMGARLQPVPFTVPHEPKYSRHSGPPFATGREADTAPYEVHGDMAKPHRTAPLQMPTPVHTRTSSTTGSSPPRVPFDPVVMSTAQPAQTSAPTPSTTRPTLQRVHTSGFHAELPPIRSSSFHLPLNERRPSFIEHTPISPALSDTSQRQVPSLVSDNHSMYSISPRTVSTPRPGILAPIEIGTSYWSEHQAATAQFNNAERSARETFGSLRNPLVNAVDGKPKDFRMNVSTLLQ